MKTTTPFILTFMLLAVGLAETAPVKADRPELEASTAIPVASSHLAIIVNKANPVDNVTSAELRNILLSERTRWPNGQKITVVMRSSGQPEREALLRAVCRMSESDYNRYSLHNTFTGQAQSGPRLLGSATGVRKFVFNVPGAVGYVRLEELDDSVKAVRVDGHAVGEPGYRIVL
jgi:phosphate transport system substrate-binding protein